jgi:5-methyltetrahydropteroyltriglutamate--homocysteine methyltransferase
MPAQLNPPFRADVVGSLLRPAYLKEARAELSAGRITPAQLAAVEDQAVREAVALQEAVGLAVATDGEMRRGTYSENFTTSGLDGVVTEHTGTGKWAYSDGKGGTRNARIPKVTGRIRWSGGQSGGAGNVASFTFLKGAVKSAVPKITMPGPCYIYQRAGRDSISRDAYPSLDQFWSDLASAYHAEMKALHDAGCRYLQLDDTAVAKLGDPKIQAALAERGDDWKTLLGVYAEAINAVVAGAPKDMHVALHLCRGNQAGHWQAEGGYDPVAEHLFRRVNVGTYFLEFDSPRAGTFAPLAALPADKVVVLGLVSTKVGTLEDAGAIEARIREAAKVVPLERLCVSAQCGFASSEAGNPLSYDEQRAKLERVVGVARKVWKD